MSTAVESTSRASYLQRSMWAAAQRHRDAPLNVMILAWRVLGPLDLELLQAAVDDVVARHPTLRARLALREGQLLQEVLTAEPVPVELREADGSTDWARLDAAVASLREGGRQRIDIASGRPLAVRVVRVSPADHLLCLYVHHAMCDGWSAQVIIRDLAACYAARSQRLAPALPPLAVQYADIAEQEILAFESGGFTQEIDYWRAELADPPPPLVLPASGARKGNRNFFARSPVHAEPTTALAALRAMARSLRVSTFSVLLSALSALMRGRTGAEDMIIGVPTLNRWSPAAMNLVGCATSLLPARIRSPGATGFDDLCRQVHSTVRRLLAYGRVPLELILRETQGSVLAGPVMPVWCQTREIAAPTVVGTTGLTMTPLTIERGTLLAELDIDMIECGEGLLCEFAHRVSLFEPEFIAALQADYGHILHAVMREPRIRIAEP